jgi:hypothetical protein
MKKPIALTFCLFLAGCSDADWNHVLNFGGGDATDEAVVTAPQAAPVPVAAGEPANGEFCKAVAAQDANSNDFDRATQSRVYARSYAQCLTLYTR